METLIKCYISRSVLGAALELCLPTRWHADLFASRFLNSSEERSIVNELELLLFGRLNTLIIIISENIN